MAVRPGSVRRGDIVVIRLPRDKARPAVVARSDLLSELPYATVLPITSELRVEVSIRVDLQPNLQNGLQTASQVMTDWPQTVRYVDMGPVIGRLDAATMRAITRQVAVVLGIGAGSGRPRRTGSPAIGAIDPP